MKTLAEHESWIKERPDFYTAIAFRGRGQYDRREAGTLAEATAAAGGMVQDRPVLVYAVRDRRQALVESVSKRTQ